MEELKILADEHQQQLDLLRNQLTEQIDKMSAETESIQAEHEAELQKEKVGHFSPLIFLNYFHSLSLL